MKMKQTIWMVMLVTCFTGLAYAETISGTVTAIDTSSRNVTLKQADTNAMMTIHVPENTSLDTLATGRQVSMDANRNGSVWEAQAFELSPDSLTSQRTSDGAQVNPATSDYSNTQKI